MKTLESLYNELRQEIRTFKENQYLFGVYGDKVTFYSMGTKAWADFIVEKEYTRTSETSVEETNALYYLSVFRALSRICYMALRSPHKSDVIAYEITPRYNIDALGRLLPLDPETDFRIDIFPKSKVMSNIPIVGIMKQLYKYISKKKYYTSVTLSGECKIKKVSMNALLFNACGDVSNVSFSTKANEIGRYESLRELS